MGQRLNYKLLIENRPSPFQQKNTLTLINPHFRYIVDSLFLLGSALYLLNRFYLRENWPGSFLANHFNDLLLVPCAIPLLLGIYRALGLRLHDDFPQAAEIFSILVIWSLLFEVAGPHLVPGTVGDWRDILVYWIGGLIAWCCWQRKGRAA